MAQRGQWANTASTLNEGLGISRRHPLETLKPVVHVPERLMTQVRLHVDHRSIASHAAVPRRRQVFRRLPVIQANHLIGIEPSRLDPMVTQEVPPTKRVAVVAVNLRAAKPTLQIRLKSLISIDRQDPVIGGQFRRAYALRPIARIRLLMDYRAEGPSNFLRAIRAARVQHQHLIHEPGKGLHAIPQVVRLIERDDCRCDLRHRMRL